MIFPTGVVVLKWLLVGVAVVALLVREVILRRLRARHQEALRAVTAQLGGGWTTLWVSERRLNRYLRGEDPASSGDETLGRLALFYTWIRRGFAAGVLLLVLFSISTK
jgi:hypothetical protein